jgi:hypothetical protein
VNWFDQLGGVLQQYAGSTSGEPSKSAEDDFDKVTTVAPREAVAGGIAEAFRSNDTPPFPNMLGQMFGRADGQQRASMLNTLLATAGPALLSGLLSRQGGGGLGSLAGMLGGGGTAARVTPEQAQQIEPQAVEEIAREAEKRDPSVIDRVSDFYAENPMLVKTLGAAALAVAMRGMAGQKRGMF